MIEILNRYTKAVLYSSATATEIADVMASAAHEGANLEGADLEGANLEGADLRGAYLEGANLRGADLRGANLEGADLRGAYLRGANLEGADLEGADLEGADLRGAYLEGANLEGADLEGADLEGADLRGADLRGANLEGADLRGANRITPKVLQILGTKHAVIVRDYGHITIGCYHKPLEWWEEHYKAIGQAENYTNIEVEEYGEHIAVCRKFMERYSILVAPIEESKI